VPTNKFMENTNEESKNEVEETTTQPDSTEEVKTEQPVVEKQDTTLNTEVVDEQVTLSKKEIENLRKKAEDFEKMIANKRNAKIAEKLKANDEDEVVETPQIDLDEVRSIAEEAAYKVVGSVKREEMEKNISSAWDEWLAENKWADDDNIFKGITQNLRPINSANKEDLLAELDRAALMAHPRLYTQSMESKIRSKILVEQNKIDVGAGGSATSVKKAEPVTINANAEDQRIADKFFGGDLERYLKTK
jgi:hypothetical protein